MLAVLLLPGVLDFALNPQTIAGGGSSSNATRVGGVPLVQWSLGLAGAYVVFGLVWLVVWLVPALSWWVGHRLLGGRVSARTDLFMDYLRDLRLYISVVIFMVIAVISFFVLARPDVNGDGEAVCAVSFHVH